MYLGAQLSSTLVQLVVPTRPLPVRQLWLYVAIAILVRGITAYGSEPDVNDSGRFYLKITPINKQSAL